MKFITILRIKNTLATAKGHLLAMKSIFNRYWIILPIVIIISYKNLKSIMINDTENIYNEIINIKEETIQETDEESGKDVLRVGVHENIAGLSRKNNQTGLHYGIEIEIAKELAKRMGYKKIHFMYVTPTTRGKLLLEDKLDIVAASCTIDDNPPLNIAYSEPYMEMDSQIVTMKSSKLKKLTDLDKLNMGVFANSINRKQARDYLSKRNIYPNFKSYDTYDELFNALFSGKVDSVAVDKCIEQTYEETYELCEIGINVDIMKSKFGIMAKENSSILKKVNSILAEMKKNGELKEITKKWNY